MLNILPILLSLLAPPSDTRGDLRVTLTAPQSVERGSTFAWSATVENAGPDALPNVFLTIGIADRNCVDPQQPIALAVGERRRFDCSFTVPATVPPYGFNAGVFAFAPGNRDPNYNDNQADQLVSVISGPDIIGGIEGVPTATPGLPVPVIVNYSNYSLGRAERTTITLSVPRALGFRQLPQGCTASGNVAMCEAGATEPFLLQPGGAGPQRRLRFEVIAPDESETTFDAIASISTVPADEHPENNNHTRAIRTFRTMFVTNTNDSGSGSLRAAIEEANARCLDSTPCMIAFRIPTVEGVYSIRPESPLPRLVAENLSIDGTTQSRYFANSNPIGPEIEINGSRLPAGNNGLDVAVPCELEIRGLAINAVRGHAIDVRSPAAPCRQTTTGTRVIHENYLGTTAVGESPLGNLRGIFVDSAVPVGISRNLISGNTRAGVFVVRGANGISENTIGLDGHRITRMGNGASGVYLGPDADGTDVSGNYIGFNAEAGVAIAVGAEDVAVFRNSIQANGQGGIDYGLDGPTDQIPVPAPEILSATYDAGLNRTFIEVRIPSGAVSGYVEIYANDGPDAEGQYYLGDWAGGNTFRVVGDMRGKWITGLTVRRIITTFATTGPEAITPYFRTATSEFSRPLQAQ